MGCKKVPRYYFRTRLEFPEEFRAKLVERHNSNLKINESGDEKCTRMRDYGHHKRYRGELVKAEKLSLELIIRNGVLDIDSEEEDSV